METLKDEFYEEGPVQAFRLASFSPEWLDFASQDARRQLLEDPNLTYILLKTARELWVVFDRTVPILVLGIIPYSMIGSSAYIWLVPFRALKAIHLPTLRRMFRKHAIRFPMLHAKVTAGSQKEMRFAEFFGFKPAAVALPHIVYERTA